MRARKKPVVVEVARVADLLDAAGNGADLPGWVQAAYDAGIILFLNDGIDIHTLEGVMHGRRDDWLIQGVQGELYPCADTVFTATYDLVL